jgi:TolA-binding protein
MYPCHQLFLTTPVLTRHGAYSQRALRNRKRQRVQELEAQFSASELRINFLESENKRLKHELLLTQDENRNLRKVTRAQASSNALRSTSWREVTKTNEFGSQQSLDRETPHT